MIQFHLELEYSFKITTRNSSLERPSSVPSFFTPPAHFIIPTECVVQRREVNQFLQSDVLHCVFVRAHAIDQSRTFKYIVVNSWIISSKYSV